MENNLIIYKRFEVEKIDIVYVIPRDIVNFIITAKNEDNDDKNLTIDTKTQKFEIGYKRQDEKSEEMKIDIDLVVTNFMSGEGGKGNKHLFLIG